MEESEYSLTSTIEETRWLTQVRSLLCHNVPRFIAHIAARGGVKNEEWKWLQSSDESLDSPEYIFARCDEYLLYPKTIEIFEKSLFILVKALAIMSFIPEGVLIFGLRFCNNVDNFVNVEYEI